MTIKLDRSGESYWRNTTDGFSATGMTVVTLLRSAYGLLMANQIAGLPGWASSEPLEVQAKMDAETMAALARLSPAQQFEQRQTMLQALLHDRFALKVHHTTRKLPVYVLSIANGGTRLKRSKSDSGGSASYSHGRIAAQGVSIANLAMNLSATVGRIIEDKTGLTGSYDFTLDWTAEGADSSDPGPSIFTAIQEQLGLKLTPAQGPVDVLVVDSIQRPSPN